MEQGRIIRELRRQQGVSQQSLARRARTSQAAISDIERGRVSPSFETVGRLLLCLGHRLRLDAQPLPMDAPVESLMEAERLTPLERLERIAATSSFVLRHRTGASEPDVARRRSPSA
jgi:transcriptional regulator with XRE-family HTH domain